MHDILISKFKLRKFKLSTSFAMYHSSDYHFYADDTQLYLAFKSECPKDMACCKATVEQCIRSIDNWMLTSKLKQNHDKTEPPSFT